LQKLSAVEFSVNQFTKKFTIKSLIKSPTKSPTKSHNTDIMNQIQRLFFTIASSAGIIVMAAAGAIAQTLPPIYENTSVELVSAQTIATFPVNTFLENIAVAAEGTLYVTSHEDGKILQLSPTGESSVYATIAGKVAGLAVAQNGDLIVSGWDSQGVPTVFRVGEQQVETLVTLPDALFLNGIVHLSGDRYLIADSYRGAIWQLDIAQRTAQIWLEHPLLTRRSADSQTPAVNGIKLFQGMLYASNTDRMLLLQIPIEAGAAATPKVIAENVNIDDFAFDTDGTLYGATHIYNSLIRRTPDGQLTLLAEAEQGMTGSTAVAFGRSEGDRTAIYVVTNGGMFLPPPTGVQPAEVVRLEVGKTGR
jgi:hypothetical protein